MPRVRVISREGCHLCEKVIGVLSSLSSRYDFDLEVLDAMDAPGLHAKYWLTIPVVSISGEDVFDARDMTVDSGYAKKLEQLVKRHFSNYG